MRLLITGADSQLGRCLQDLLSGSENIILAANHSELDISSVDSITNIFTMFAPSIVINTAAYTAVDRAETEADQAYTVNKEGAYNLARACETTDTTLIHISTDYVFDGTASNPYKSDDQTNPQSIYGKSKLAGELEVSAILPTHVIIRTAWVFSEYNNNFVNTILSLADKQESIEVVIDQYGCPTYAGDLAKALLRICKLISTGHHAWGTYHYCGDHQVNWHGFATAVVEEAQSQKLLLHPVTVCPITSSDYQVPTPRPAYSVLDMQSAIDTWGIKPSAWHTALEHIIKLRVEYNS